MFWFSSPHQCPKFHVATSTDSPTLSQSAIRAWGIGEAGTSFLERSHDFLLGQSPHRALLWSPEEVTIPPPIQDSPRSHSKGRGKWTFFVGPSCFFLSGWCILFVRQLGPCSQSIEPKAHTAPSKFQGPRRSDFETLTCLQVFRLKGPSCLSL